MRPNPSFPSLEDRESVRNCVADPPRAVYRPGIDKNARWHAAWTFTACASGTVGGLATTKATELNWTSEIQRVPIPSGATQPTEKLFPAIDRCANCHLIVARRSYSDFNDCGLLKIFELRVLRLILECWKDFAIHSVKGWWFDLVEFK